MCTSVRLGSTTRHVSFYTSLDGGGLRPSGPHQVTVVVFGYTYVSSEHYTPNICRSIYISVYRTRNCKLVGVWVGVRRDSGSDSD